MEDLLTLPKYRSFLLRFFIGCCTSLFLFVIFFFAQRYNYSEPDLAYFMGTKASYFFFALFLSVVTIFIFSFIKHRHNHLQLKRRFIIFSSFYLLCAIFVIFSFDSYLLVSKKGVAYNPFFSIEKTEVRPWKEIEQATLECKVNRLSDKKTRVTFHFLVDFEYGPSIDLNSYNSPLYQKEEFRSIYNALVQNHVPIHVKKDLPSDLASQYPFFAQICNSNQTEQILN